MRALLVAVCVLACAAIAPALASAQGSTSPYSVSVPSLFAADGALTPNGDRQLAALRTTGLQAARMDAPWATVEPFPGMRSFDALDRIATALASHGLRWLPTLGYTPLWDRAGGSSDKVPPSSDAAFASYAAAVAARYGPGGAFWAQNPVLPALPIQDVEVWNEPNWPAYWQPRPDATRYAGLYLAARDAIGAVAPGVKVLVGGLSAYADPGKFVTDMIAAQPRLRTAIDAVGFHPYSSGAAGVVEQVAALRDAMNGAGLGAKPIVVTEVGWPLPNRSPTSTFALPDASRGAALDLTAQALGSGNCGVSGMTVFTWTSAMSNPLEQEDWFGIARPDASLTAAGRAYARVVASTALPDTLGTCGEGTRRITVQLRASAQPKGRRLCVTADVRYRGAPVSGMPIAFIGARSSLRPRTKDDGRLVRCLTGVRGPSVTVQAVAGDWAASAKRRVSSGLSAG